MFAFSFRQTKGVNELKFESLFGFQTINQVINLHKALIGPILVYLMILTQNFSKDAWIYFALHTSYGFLWLLKYRWFPNSSFEIEISKPLYICKRNLF